MAEPLTAPRTEHARPTGLTGFLSGGHRQLEELLQEARRSTLAGDLARSALAFHAFERSLERHVRIEEELLFALFEARARFSGGPTTTLRGEHRELAKASSAMRRAVEAGDREGFAKGFTFFNSSWSGHCSKEEHILFPALDALLSEPEQHKLLERLERERAAKVPR